MSNKSDVRTMGRVIHGRVTSAVVIHAAAFLVAVLSLGSGPGAVSEHKTISAGIKLPVLPVRAVVVTARANAQEASAIPAVHAKFSDALVPANAAEGETVLTTRFNSGN